MVGEEGVVKGGGEDILAVSGGGRAEGEQLSHRGMVVVQDQEALDGPLPHLKEDHPPCTQRMVI